MEWVSQVLDASERWFRDPARSHELLEGVQSLRNLTNASIVMHDELSEV